MRVFKTRAFHAFACGNRIADHLLLEAAQRADLGLVDADLGGGVIKQRIARDGAGRSGGYRAVIFFRRGERSIFVYGYAKNDRANISRKELAEYRTLAEEVLALNDDAISKVVETGGLVEIENNA